MSTPNLDWNQIVSGKRPRGSLELSQLRGILARWIKVADSAIYQTVENNDLDLFIRLLHVGSLVAARFESLTKNSDLEERLVKLEGSKNGVRP